MQNRRGPAGHRGVGDTFPLSDDEIGRALRAAVNDPDQIDRVFTLPDAGRLINSHTSVSGTWIVERLRRGH